MKEELKESLGLMLQEVEDGLHAGDHVDLLAACREQAEKLSIFYSCEIFVQRDPKNGMWTFAIPTADGAKKGPGQKHQFSFTTVPELMGFLNGFTAGTILSPRYKDLKLPNITF